MKKSTIMYALTYMYNYYLHLSWCTIFHFLCTICKAFCVAPTATHNKCQL